GRFSRQRSSAGVRGRACPWCWGGYVNRAGRCASTASSAKGRPCKIYLPRTAETAPRRSVRRQQVPSVGGAGILVVDDDPDVRWVTAECLRGIGHHVTGARAGGAALTILGRGKPFDLVVIDLAIPELSGAETVRLETGGDALLRNPSDRTH